MMVPTSIVQQSILYDKLMMKMLRGVHLIDHLKFHPCGLHANMFTVSYQENQVKIMILSNLFLC